MTVIGIRAPGGPEMLVPEERPVPAPGPGEILVKVAAAGVNRPDVRQRQGTYPPPKGATDIPGLEIAGEVAAIGPDVKRWKLGDKVCALVVGGGYAQYCLAYESHALPVPAALSMVEAAAIPETFFTCWQNMFMRADVNAGDWVLVHGGTSGIGTTAIMLAKAFGAKVVTTAGSADKCEAAKKLGADVAVNYKTEDFVADTKEATGGKGADLIVDIVGGDYVDRNYDCAADRAASRRSPSQGAKADGTSPPDDEAPDAHGLHAPPPQRRREGRHRPRSAERVWPLVAAGKIKPVINSTFPLGQGRRGPCANGDELAHRQDRPDRLGLNCSRPGGLVGAVLRRRN